jgi:hypothetical protein
MNSNKPLQTLEKYCLSSEWRIWTGAALHSKLLSLLGLHVTIFQKPTIGGRNCFSILSKMANKDIDLLCTPGPGETEGRTK